MPIRKAVIPAAGFGTRLLPATKAQPKEMLPLLDLPMIQYAVEEAAAAGIADVLVVTSRGKGALEDHFDRIAELEDALVSSGKDELLARVRRLSDLAQIHFVRQPEALGLGHAVGCAAAHVGDEPFAVLLPDEVFPDHDLLPALVEAHDHWGASVIAVRDMGRKDISRYGSVDPEPVAEDLVRIRGFVEKPPAEEAPSTLGSIGRYVLTPDVFEALEHTDPGAGGEIQLTDAIRTVALERKAYAHVFDGRRYDVGNVPGHLAATVELAWDHPDFGEAFRTFLRRFAERQGLGEG